MKPQAVLIGLKLLGVINCSWWIVFLPIMVSLVLVILCCIYIAFITVRDFLLRRLK